MKRLMTVLVVGLAMTCGPVSADFLGTWEIDDYVGIPATTHRFSSGAAYAPTAISYSIYADGSATGIVENVDMTPASPHDSVVGLYYARKQLTAAAGFVVGKNYLVVIKKTVDSVEMLETHTFQVTDAVGYTAADRTTLDSLVPAEDQMTQSEFEAFITSRTLPTADYSTFDPSETAVTLSNAQLTEFWSTAFSAQSDSSGSPAWYLKRIRAMMGLAK